MSTDSRSYHDFEEEDSRMNIAQFLRLCAQRWKWFLLSLVAFLAIGFLYILRPQPVYERSAEVLIKDQDQGGSSSMDLAGAFSSLGLFGAKSSVYNELIALRSPAIMSEVVKRLDLTTTYYEKGAFHWNILYGAATPFTVVFDGDKSKRGAIFRAALQPDGTMKLYKFITFSPDGKPIKHDKEIEARIGATVLHTPAGNLMLMPNPNYKGVREEEMTVIVTHTTPMAAINNFCGNLKVDLVDQDAEVIGLKIKDLSPTRAEDILDEMIVVYNEKWIEDKNKLAISTSQFINERLALIEKELGEVDTDISNYKSEHLLTDLQEASSIYMNQAALISDKMLEVSNQLSMAKFMLQYIDNPAKRHDVLPVNTGVGSMVVEQEIPVYNTLLMQRNLLASNSSENNPAVRDMDQQLASQRSAIRSAVSHQIETLQGVLSNLRHSQGESESHLASTPSQALYLLSIERQQKVKEALYIYLLQKREENEINMTYEAYNTRIITPPDYGDQAPVSPKKGIIMLVAFVLGLAIPGVALYMAETGNTKVRSRKDLDNLSVPFLGEIPFHGSRHRIRSLFRTRKQKQKQIDTPLKVVSEGNRDVVNEAFRVVRTNLEMMMGRSSEHQVVMMTSFNPGSGKSFVIFNLGATFALKRKRVLMIDADLRHGSLSMYVGSPRHGVANYLSGKTDDWRQDVVSVPEHDDLYILPIGYRPPNPAELLESPRLKSLIEGAREDYDLVLIDCPPVDIVVDTQLVAPYADRTLFVVRAGLFEKEDVVDIDELYASGKFRQMSLLLNGTAEAHTRYHAYGYHSDI